jgi:PAS domain S-box-containing protein
VSRIIVKNRRAWWYGGITLVAVGLLLAYFSSNSIKNNAARERASEWEQHSMQVVIEARILLSALQQIDASERDYLLTGEPRYLLPFQDGMADTRVQLVRIKQLTGDNPRQQDALKALGDIVAQRLELATTAVHATRAERRSAALNVARADREQVQMNAAQANIGGILAEEQRLLELRRATSLAARMTNERNSLIVLGLGMLFFAVAAAAFYAAIRADIKTQVSDATARANLIRLKSEAEAQRVGALLKAIGDVTPAMLYAKDSRGRLTYGNPSMLSVLGKSAEQAVGKTHADIAPDRAQGEIISGNDLRIMAGGTVETVDEILTGPDQKTRVLRSTKTPLRDAKGEVIGLAGVTVDISEESAMLDSLKESEERFRTLSNTLPAFIFVADIHGAFTYTNHVFQSFTGKSAEDLLDFGWLETLHPDDRGEAAHGWADAWQSGKNYDAEYRVRQHTDGYRVFIVRAMPVRDARDAIFQWVGTCIDTQDLVDARNDLKASNTRLELGVAERTADLQNALTSLRTEVEEREAAESQLRQLQKMESIGQLTGGIAHDFNNMLAIVIGSLDLAKRRLLTEPQRALKSIENAEEGARRSSQLTARLLAYSRQQALTPEVLNVNKLVGGMSELLRRTIGESVRVETVLAGGLWNSLADSVQLESAIVNLCVNARDAMPNGGKLTIETANAHLDDAYAARSPGTTPGQYVLIGVTDTGIGMPPEVVERAFDPFYTTKGVGKGTGLGLSQVYGFVRQSGGHVKIYSEPGQGTTVKIYLPRHTAVAEVLDVEEKILDQALPAAKEGEILLVVEDEEAVRRMAVDVLRDLGYTVVQASDGPQAIDILHVQPRISLLFTDVVMPKMNGRVLADQAKKMRPELKVLFTTGYTRNAVVHNGMLDAGVAFLPKPFTVAELARKVRRVLDGGGINR